MSAKRLYEVLDSLIPRIPQHRYFTLTLDSITYTLQTPTGEPENRSPTRADLEALLRRSKRTLVSARGLVVKLSDTSFPTKLLLDMIIISPDNSNAIIIDKDNIDKVIRGTTTQEKWNSLFSQTDISKLVAFRNVVKKLVAKIKRVDGSDRVLIDDVVNIQVNTKIDLVIEQLEFYSQYASIAKYIRLATVVNNTYKIIETLTLPAKDFKSFDVGGNVGDPIDIKIVILDSTHRELESLNHHSSIIKQIAPTGNNIRFTRGSVVKNTNNVVQVTYDKIHDYTSTTGIKFKLISKPTEVSIKYGGVEITTTQNIPLRTDLTIRSNSVGTKAIVIRLVDSLGVEGGTYTLRLVATENLIFDNNSELLQILDINSGSLGARQNMKTSTHPIANMVKFTAGALSTVKANPKEIYDLRDNNEVYLRAGLLRGEHQHLITQQTSENSFVNAQSRTILFHPSNPRRVVGVDDMERDPSGSFYSGRTYDGITYSGKVPSVFYLRGKGYYKYDMGNIYFIIYKYEFHYGYHSGYNSYGITASILRRKVYRFSSSSGPSVIEDTVITRDNSYHSLVADRRGYRASLVNVSISSEVSASFTYSGLQEGVSSSSRDYFDYHGRTFSWDQSRLMDTSYIPTEVRNKTASRGRIVPSYIPSGVITPPDYRRTDKKIKYLANMYGYSYKDLPIDVKYRPTRLSESATAQPWQDDPTFARTDIKRVDTHIKCDDLYPYLDAGDDINRWGVETKFRVST